MKIPRGDLVRSRVVSDLGTTLETALDSRLTGYAVLEPQESLLLGDETRGVLTFDAGVPVLAYETATDRGGADALADLAVPGPYRVEVYELPPSALDDAHDASELEVPPGMPADRLAGDPALAARTRDVAPADRRGDRDDVTALEAFLDDEAKIAAIRDQAREEAHARAEEWGLADQLTEGDPDAPGD